MQRYVWLTILFLLVLGASIAGAFAYLRRSAPVSSSEVQLTLTAPKEVTSGDTVSFAVHYRNATAVPLTDVSVFFDYPEGSVPVEHPDQRIASMPLGTLAPGAEGDAMFAAQLLGARGTVLDAKTELAYKSAGVAEFRKSAEATVRVAAEAFFLDFVVPQKAVSGERIVYFVNYANLATHAFPGTRIELTYPDGFAFGSAEPAPTDGQATWDIGEVPEQGKGRITVSGTLQGNEGDTKKVRARIGFVREDALYPYAESSFDTVIAPSPLAVSVALTDNATNVVRRGQSMSVRITFKNNTEIPIKDVVVRAELGGDMFSFKSIAADRGFFDSTRNTILWTPANAKELLYLDPGVEHQVTFRVALKDTFPIDEPANVNYVARVTAGIESINVPPYLALNKISSTQTLEVKFETAPTLVAKVMYRDDTGGIVNDGPLPPRVNKTTRYTVHWLLSVPANDLENVEVRATLPTGIVATGATLSRYTDAKPTFNEASGEVVWFIPRIPANTGVLYPAYEAVFQIAVTPSLTQLGQTLELVRPSTITATDAFTGTQLAAGALALRSESASDILTRQEGLVQPEQ